MKIKAITGVMIALFLTSIMAFGLVPVNAGAGVLETLTVQADNPNPTYSTEVLQDGWWYVIEVSGTWVNFGTRQVDAKYWSDDNWATYHDLLPWAGADDRQLELVIDGNRIDWGDYRADHTYFTMYQGEGHTAAFLAFLVYEMQAGWYGDNTGSLTVTIYVSGQLPLYRGWNIFTEPGSGKVKYKFIDKRDKLLATLILEGAQPNHDYRAYFGPNFITGEGNIDPDGDGYFAGLEINPWGFVFLGYLTTDSLGNGALHVNLNVASGQTYSGCFAINPSPGTAWHTPVITFGG